MTTAQLAVALAVVLTAAGPIALVVTVLWASTPRATMQCRHAPQHRAPALGWLPSDTERLLRGGTDLDFAALAARTQT